MYLRASIAIALAALIAGCSPAPTPTAQTPPQAAASQEIRGADYVAEVSTITGAASNSDWSRIQGDGDRLVLYYRTMPTGHAQIERDTRHILAAYLQALKSRGVDPHAQQIVTGVSARKDERGATGQPVVRVFGRSQYTWSNDSIRYTPQQ